MDKKYFSLGSTENNRVVNIIRIAFGIICILIAIFWISFNVRQLKTDNTLWITVIFLTGFGFYQIWSGFGKATRFLEISGDLIRIKKNPVLPAVNLAPAQIEKIEIFPLNLIFHLKTGKKFMFRFGTTFQETNETIKDEIILFAELNNIPAEFVEEKI
jgi:hypothetical protein